MIRNEEDFSRIVQARIAPIYFFDEKVPPKEGEKFTYNGTVTLFRNKLNQIYVITCHHVYEHYLEGVRENPNYIAQLGHKLRLKLQERLVYENEKADLCVFFLHEDELKELGTKDNPKGCFRLLADVARFEHEQNKEDPSTWAVHFAGFPGVHKETQKIDERTFVEDFGISLFPIFFSYFPEEPKIALNFSETREAISKGSLPKGSFFQNMEELSEKTINFGGISGCPVFARVKPYEDDLTLLGIVYEGPDGNEKLPENFYARPITVIQDIL